MCLQDVFLQLWRNPILDASRAVWRVAGVISGMVRLTLRKRVRDDLEIGVYRQRPAADETERALVIEKIRVVLQR